MNDQLRQIALRIRELREIFGFSVEETAQKLKIASKTYSEYEASGLDIPISVLYQLAGIYNVDMTEILTGQSPKINTISYVRAGEGLAVDRFEGYQYENIGYRFMHRKMEPMIVTLESSKEKPVQVTHAGQEINYCLEGEMIVDYDGKEFYLKPGDCVYFDPTRPHGQRACGTNPAKFLTVINE